MSTLLTVVDPQGNAKVLADMLASGGEGSVYPLADNHDILVKWYHPEKLHKMGPQLQAKTEAMVQLRDHFAQLPAVCWPRMGVFNAQQQWIGYAMRRAQGVPMVRMAHGMAYRKSFPGLTRIDIVAYLRSLLAAVMTLHRQGVRVGDYNLNNILCTPGSSQVMLIDCDSYQMEYQGRVYPCPVGSPDMTPKEQHGKAFEDIYRTETSECFSVAIVLFKCLMLGRHPYDIVGGEDPVSNLRAGRFAYGRGNRGIPMGPWFNIWSHMPHRLKTMFIQTFTEGADDPAQRPSLAEWDKALAIYQNEMQKGWHETAVQPAQPKPQNYRGSRSIDQVSVPSAP